MTRDPRFGMDVSGEFSAFHFSKNYGFVTKYRENEFQTLKDHLKQARKLLASSPEHTRAERQAEVDVRTRLPSTSTRRMFQIFTPPIETRANPQTNGNAAAEPKAG